MTRQAERTTITKESIELQTNGDPIAVAIKASLEQGDPILIDLTPYEFKIKVQQVDRRGRVIQGVAYETQNLETLFDEVMDEIGPGRYNVWVSYRQVGKEGVKWSLVKVTDIALVDPEAAPEGPALQTSVNRPQQDPGERRDLFQMMLAQSQQTTQLMMAQQQQMTQVLVAVLTNKKEGGSFQELLQAVQTGMDVARGPAAESDDPMDKMMLFGSQILKMINGRKGGDSLNVDEVKKIAADSGLDKSLGDAGFEEQAT